MSNPYFIKKLLFYHSITSIFCMQLHAYKPVGLDDETLGNSCYMNSLVQILASIEPLNKAINNLPNNYYKDNADRIGEEIINRPQLESAKHFDIQALPEEIALADATAHLIKSIHSEQSSNQHAKTSSKQLWRALQPVMKKLTQRPKGSQEDTTEAWTAVVTALCLNPFIHNTFIEHLNITGDQEHSIVEYALNLNFEEEEVINQVGEHTGSPLKNLDTLDRCLKHSVQQRGTIERISSYVVINIPRVYYRQGSTFKDSSFISIPLELNFKEYVKESVHNQFGYHLHAMARHHGTGNTSGHYVAYIRGDDAWYHCNDSTVTKIEDETAMLKEVGQGVYLLVYKQGIAPQFQHTKQQSFQDNQEYSYSYEDFSEGPRRQQGPKKKMQQSLKHFADALNTLERTLKS